jgi:DDE superfamily endonuclease
MSLPISIIQVLQHFRPAFTLPTWHKVQLLVVGTLLARGRRTVTAALKQMGLHQDQHFTLYHQVLNRACWSSLTMSRLLLQLIISTFIAAGGTLEIVIDETLERRWGPKISKRCHHRDKMKSSKQQSVTSSGLRWVVMMVVVQLPWTHRVWALPFFSVLATTPKVSEKLGKPHKTIAQIAQQMVITVRRWFPDAAQVPMKLIGDTAYSTVELGLCCERHNVTLVAPLRLDSRLYEPAPDITGGKRRSKGQKGVMGRPRVKGAALPKVSSVLDNPTTEWRGLKVRWYDGIEQTLLVTSGTAVWYCCMV